MARIYYRCEPFSKADVTLALESGVDGVIVPRAQVEKVAALSRCAVWACEDVASVPLNVKADEEALVARLKAGETACLARGWEIIPVENLLAQAGNVLAETGSLEEARLAAGILERGVDGIVVLPEALAELKAIVDAKLSTAPASVQGKARAEIWTRFNRHFKIAEYAQLPACRMPEARDYLIELQMKSYPTKTAAAVPANAEHEIETHCAAMRGLVRQLNAHMDEIFNIARKSKPDLRTPGERRELALASIYSMEDAAGAIGHNIAVLERTAKTTLIAARM